MEREDIEMVRRIVPETMHYHYTPDRESLWLLSELMPESMKVAALRGTPYGKLLSRASVKPVVAACGGLLRRERVAEALDKAVYQDGWRDYALNLEKWAVGRRSGWEQVIPAAQLIDLYPFTVSD